MSNGNRSLHSDHTTEYTNMGSGGGEGRRKWTERFEDIFMNMITYWHFGNVCSKATGTPKHFCFISQHTLNKNIIIKYF